jgi:hypothetical protein
MPRYFFNIYNDEVTLDEEGIELADDSEALSRAAAEARNLASETVRQGHLILDHRLEIVDESEREVGTVTFGDAIKIQPESDRDASV